MKKILILISVLLLTFTFSSCNKEDGSPALTEDQYPLILNTISENYTMTGGSQFKMYVYVTPANLAQIVWKLDGSKIGEGNTLDFTLPKGYAEEGTTGELQIIVTTPKYEITRTAVVSYLGDLPDSDEGDGE